MSLEHSPARATGTAIQSGGPSPSPAAPEGDEDYWYGLIDEKAAGSFIGLVPRTMQAMRQRGGGPRYVAISSRCLRYRRIDLREWSEARMRTSTADEGAGAAP